MRIHFEYKNPTPSHCDIAIFVNGALAGEITLRQGEIITFQDIILHGINPKLDKFNATGNSSLVTELEK